MPMRHGGSFAKTLGRAGASADGGRPLAQSLLHAPGKPTWRYRDQSLQSSAQVAPPNRGSLKRHPLRWHSRAGGGAVHSITFGLMRRSKGPYSITSSASASRSGGTSRRIAFAIPRLIANKDRGAESFPYRCGFAVRPHFRASSSHPDHCGAPVGM
jgi:hypothetical protein